MQHLCVCYRHCCSAACFSRSDRNRVANINDGDGDPPATT